jgi:Tfp pilus assembly protein PilF
MAFVRLTGTAALAAIVLTTSSLASVSEGPAGGSSVHAPALRLAQSTAPSSAQSTDRAPKETRTPKPPRDGEAKSQAPSTPALPPPSIEEVAYRGQRIRTLHYATTGTLQIEVNGRTVATVRSVGQIKKPRLIPGTIQSLVVIWSRNTAQNCSSNVLVAVPMREGGEVEVKPGFGACNMNTRQLSMKRDNWESWALLAYREDSPKVGVAVSRNGKLSVTEQPAKPCLFSKSSDDQARCNDEYIADGQGSVERGIQSGEQRAGGHRLATFYNRAKNTGDIELDGRPYKAFSNVKAFHVESSVAFADSALFSMWIQPTNETCGYRMLLRVPAGEGEHQVWDRVGPCRRKSLTHVQTRPDRIVSGWAKFMWQDGDRHVDIASWTGSSVTLSSVEADPCLFAPGMTQECIDRMLPAGLTKAAPGAAPGSAGAPALSASQGRVALNPAVTKAFELLSHNQIDLALAEFDRALISEPNSALAYTGRGYGLALKGKLDNAMADLDRAVQLNPRSAHAFSYRGFVFLLRNEPDRALTQLDQALLLDARSSEAYAFRGSAHFLKGNKDLALTDLNKAIEIKPKNAVALGMRARVYASQKDHQKAVDDFTAALAIVPSSISNHVGRGQALEALGQSNGALVAYKAAITLKPATFGDIAAQAIAKQRITVLGGAAGCAKGQDCL